MADKVASLYGELTLDDQMTPSLKKAEGSLNSFGGKLKAAGKNVASFGAGMLKISAPFVAGIGLAISAAVAFDEQIGNIASVMGLTAAESREMGDAMLEISQTTKFSATEMAGAMYDVVGGVADASAHMDILAASALLAEGSNADLVASTNALVSTYNAYSAAGVEASRVSDVLTATVRDGVGTMDELAAVFATTATLASPLGVDIEELGFLFAELSKKGATFSESGTRIEAALSALINPTQELEDAFEQMGMTQADVLKMLDEQGLVAVIEAMTAAGVDLTAVFGNKEALLGVLAIAEVDSTGLNDFATSLEGATVAARDIQAETAAFKWQELQGDVSDLAVVVGESLLPAFEGIVAELSPIVQGLADWAKENPQLVQDIAKVALIAAGLGLVLAPIGTILGVITTGFGAIVAVKGAIVGAIGAITLAAGPLAAPFWAAAAAIGAVTAAIALLNSKGPAERWGYTPEDMATNAQTFVEDFNGIQAQNQPSWTPGGGSVAPHPQTQFTPTPGNFFAGGANAPLPPPPPNNGRGRAEGGPVVAGMPYRVGERGAEWFMPSVDGTVLNQRQARGMGSISIGTLVLQGVNDVQKLYDELTKVGMQRGG